MQQYSLQHTVTFDDTNVVGNAYFLAYFQWQLECLDEWLRTSLKPPCSINPRWEGRLLSHLSTRFVDPVGATVGDQICVRLDFGESDMPHTVATSEVLKLTGCASTQLACGKLSCVGAETPPRCQDDGPSGPCYSIAVPTRSGRAMTSIDLIGLQGKCRELFLIEHAEATLRLVVERALLLQTTTASLDMLQPLPNTVSDVRVDMRLESIKCGQMTVRFDYFAELRDGTRFHFAKGLQKMSSKHQRGSAVVPCPFPTDLLIALREFTESKDLLGRIEDILTFASAPCTAV